MFSRKLTRSITVGAAAIAVAGGSYGIVSATSGSSLSRCQHHTPAAGPSSGGRGSNARSGPAGGGSSGTVSSLSTSGFTLTTSAGQKVTVKEGLLHDIPEGEEPGLSECHHNRRKRPGTRDGQQYDHHGHAGHRGTGWHRRIGSFLGGRGGPLPARCTEPRQRRSVRSRRTTVRGRGRSSAERQRIGRRKLRWPPTRGGIVDRVVQTEQRRVRGPLHRRQLAAPRLRQPGLQGHRRRLVVAPVNSSGTPKP